MKRAKIALSYVLEMEKRTQYRKKSNGKKKNTCKRKNSANFSCWKKKFTQIIAPFSLIACIATGKRKKKTFLHKFAFVHIRTTNIWWKHLNEMKTKQNKNIKKTFKIYSMKRAPFYSALFYSNFLLFLLF